MRLNAVDEMLDDPLVDLTAQLEVVHKDVLHRHCLQDLGEREQGQVAGAGGRRKGLGQEQSATWERRSPPETQKRLHP